MNEQIEAVIKEFAGPEGFWKSNAEESLRQVFKDLTGYGLSVEQANDAISAVWTTACEEYGD